MQSQKENRLWYRPTNVLFTKKKNQLMSCLRLEVSPKKKVLKCETSGILLLIVEVVVFYFNFITFLAWNMGGVMWIVLPNMKLGLLG